MSRPAQPTGLGWNSGTIGLSYGRVAPISPPLEYFQRPSPLPYQGFQRVSSKGITTINTPIWFLALLTGIPAGVTIVRYPWRFSLRTMLTAMTLVAVVLGLAVWASW